MRTRYYFIFEKNPPLQAKLYLIHSMEGRLREKLITLDKKFPDFYRNRRFINVLLGVCPEAAESSPPSHTPLL
jgi:hypothetical protein